MSPGPEDAIATTVAVSKGVVVMDHIKNNRIEYLVLMAIGTMMGWTQEAMTLAQGVCA